MSNFFKALAEGVQGVLQGKILSVKTKRFQKDGKEKVLTFARIGLPGMYINFEMIIPEQFVPNCVENKEIHLLPRLRLGKWDKCELDFDIKGIQ